MKSISAFIFVGLMVSASQADVGKGLIYHMDWVQRNLKGMNQCVEGSTSSTTAQSEDLADLCMSQVCGTADKVQTPAELTHELLGKPNLMKTLWESLKEFEDGIDDLLNKGTKEKILTIEAYRDLQKRKDLTPVAPYVRFHDFSAMINELKRSSLAVGPTPQQPIVLNREATLAKLTGLSEEQKKWTADSLDHFFRSQIGGEFILQNLTEPRDFFKLKHPNLSLKDALKAEGQNLQKIGSKLLDGPNSSTVRLLTGGGKSFTDPVVTKAANGEDMTDAEVSEFMSIRATASLCNDILTPKEEGGQTLLLPSSSQESLADFIKRKNFDQQITQYEIDLKDKEKVKSKRDVVFTSCYTNYIFQMATLPSGSQIEVAKKNGTWAKNRIKEVLNPVLSVQTKQLLNEVIDKSFFSMPKNQELFHRNVMEMLKRLTSDIEDSEREYGALVKNGQHKSLTLSTIHLNSDNYQIDKHFKYVQNFCDKFKISFTNDNALTSTGGIQVSWVSVRNPELGKSVMLHELGHLAFENLDSEKASVKSRGHFQNIRKCLADNHSEQGGPYVEEDWSDLISAKGAGLDNSSFGCELSEQENNKYINLRLSDPEAKDPHSTDFFRVLHLYKVQNSKLPSACNQFVESQGNKWSFRSCF